MRPCEFRFELAETLGDALAVLSGTDDAVALAGGQSLVPLLRFRMSRPTVVVDITRLPGLDRIVVTDAGLEVGANVTTAEVAASSTIRELCPLWSEAAGAIGDPLVRNVGTVGGNLAHAFPLNDLPAALVAAGGRVAVDGKSGQRIIHAGDFFEGPLVTSLRPGELITKVVLSHPSAGAYEKLKRSAVDYGVAGVAVHLRIGADGEVAAAGIAVTGAQTPGLAASEAADLLTGRRLDDDLIRRAAAATSAACTWSDDGTVAPGYRSALVGTLTMCALTRAIGHERSAGP